MNIWERFGIILRSLIFDIMHDESVPSTRSSIRHRYMLTLLLADNAFHSMLSLHGERSSACRSIHQAIRSHMRKVVHCYLREVLVKRRENGPRTLTIREDIPPRCRRGRLIPEDVRPSPSYPEEHLQGRSFLLTYSCPNHWVTGLRERRYLFFMSSRRDGTLLKNITLCNVLFTMLIIVFVDHLCSSSI